MKQVATAPVTGKTLPVRLMAWTAGAVLLGHAVVCALSLPSDVSRWFTAAIAFLTAVCVLLRMRRLPWAERLRWFWGATGLFLWGVAHATETVISRSSAASNLSVDGADFIYLAAIFPLLLVFSTTHETQFLRSTFILNCLQLTLAGVVAYVLLYGMQLSPSSAATVMGRIYGVACGLAALMSLVRSLTWATVEERRCVRWISVFLWIYLPIELGMDFASRYWNLKAGTPLDLLWSLPFVITAWKALTLPFDSAEDAPSTREGKLRIVVECLCPLLINASIFALAASVIGQHLGVGLVVLFILLLIQGVQSAFIQMHYLAGRRILLRREQELRHANAALQELSLLDPLTGIANRRRFDAELKLAWQFAARRRQPLSLLLIDIDYFKGVNDSHGHSYGDQCLVMLADLLKRHTQQARELVARLGGEEFVFLLPESDLAAALALSSRLHEAIRDLVIQNEASPFAGRMTVSIGVTTAMPLVDTLHAVLIDTADRALYTAKANGRNRTHAIRCSQAGAASGQGQPERVMPLR